MHVPDAADAAHVDTTTRPTPVLPALSLLAVGITGIALSLRLPLLEGSTAGPGFWPLLISCTMAATAAVVVARPALRTATATTRSDVVRVGLGLMLLGAFAVLLPAIGLVSTSVIVGVLWLRLLSRDPWPTSIGVPVAVAAGMYLVFVQLLEVPVPVDAWLPR